jgi:hypothetical protein
MIEAIQTHVFHQDIEAVDEGASGRASLFFFRCGAGLDV